ncbi:MAG TPA: DUF481 domain-containing protein [Pseudomonas sp.]|nr:DUF481 domain-containing protein [Pseudomonas sp.]
MSLRILLPFLLLALSLPAGADTVWLNNGDRLSGEIILLDGGKLALQTKYAGRVLIEWQDIDTLSADKPLLLRRTGLDSQHGERLQAARPGQVQVTTPGGKPAIIPLASISRLVPPRPLLKDRLWEGNVDAKLDLDRDEDSTDELTIKGDMRLEHGRWRHVLNGQMERETENNEKTEDNWELEYDLDRFFTEHWFLRTGYQHDEDQFEQIQRQRIAGIGPGYRFWDNELGRFDLVSRANRVRLDTQNGDISFNSWSLEWDYKRLLWGTRFEFYSTGELQVPQIEEIDYVFEGEAGLRYRLNDWARLSLLYELNQVRGLGQPSNDERYLLGIGVGW